MRADLSREERINLLDVELLNDWDFGQWIVSIVEAAGEYLTAIVGEQAAAEGLTTMLAPVGAATGYTYSGNEWRRILEDAMPAIYGIWPIARRLEEAAAYAIYGVILQKDVAPSERRRYIESLVSEMMQFIDKSPLALWKISASDQDIQLTKIVRLAANRMALDDGGLVEPAALAEFGGVSEGRIRNMMSGNDRKLGNEGGRIPAADALAWLKDRAEFFDSIWESVDEPEQPSQPIDAASTVLFIPVGRDGTPFHPGLIRGGNYTVGTKGDEVQIADFSDALAHLQRMPAPSWRRPNDVGNWGIIRGVEWKRFTTDELHGLPANFRIPTRDRLSD
ncbi:hypothetical protein [Rhizobium sp. TRM95796]|uniref:hypothetical protein n=1 Tax=Rhizobium sp. TRM95796 TaxID=2979862 RepID=UPI0021E88E6D|nr:hypothetical protein [Rhizobium sp. TRM95796]MCV3765144.1 hypothetical protein [Rhizobium sp. TRM95796]